MSTRLNQSLHWPIWLTAVAATLCCGCFKVKEQLVIREDGSGTVHIETQSLLPAEQLGMMGQNWMDSGEMGESSAWMAYPPLNQAAAMKLFPGKDFVVSHKTKTENGESVAIVDVTFQDINALLASPYARAHSMHLSSDGKKLTFKALSGQEMAARMMTMKDESGGGMDAMMAMPPDWQKQKDRMSIEFTLTLPKDIAASTGAQQGKSVTWIVDRAKLKDDAEAVKAFSAVFEASCPAEGLGFTPNSPVRLALGSFKDVPTGPTVAKSAVPDSKKVAAATRFVPCKLQVTRSVDLSGQGYAHNQASLTGIVLTPREFAPQQWGKVVLDKVLDEKGNSLQHESEEHDGFSMVQSWSSHMAGIAEEAAQPQTESRHTVTMNFKAPDWKAKEIARIEGSVEMMYFGSSEVVKVENAIAKEWLKDASSGHFSGFDEGGRSLSNPRLAELGLPLKLTMAMRNSGMTTLSFQLEGQTRKSALTEVQVFDATGNPWPCVLQSQDMGDNDFLQVMIAGDPPAPLSLALLVSGGGDIVKLPILLEHVPLGAREPKKTDK